MSDKTFTPGLDVIIVAGGRGERVDGRDKATIRVDGQRLIDILLDDVSLIGDLMQVVVVSSREPELRPGVKLVAEDPPFSGPASAVAAGVAALAGEASAETAILAVDAPQSATLIPDLRAELHSAEESPDAAIIEQNDGVLQPLCAVWRTAALHQVMDTLDTEGLAVRELVGHAHVVKVAGDGAERDYDTLAELADFGDLD